MTRQDLVAPILFELKQRDENHLIKFLSNYTKLFNSQLSGGFSEDTPFMRLFCLGMCGLLNYTIQDIEFACLEVERSKVQEKMQNVLVNEITYYLSRVKTLKESEV